MSNNIFGEYWYEWSEQHDAKPCAISILSAVLVPQLSQINPVSPFMDGVHAIFDIERRG